MMMRRKSARRKARKNARIKARLARMRRQEFATAVHSFIDKEQIEKVDWKKNGF